VNDHIEMGRAFVTEVRFQDVCLAIWSMTRQAYHLMIGSLEVGVELLPKETGRTCQQDSHFVLALNLISYIISLIPRAIANRAMVRACLGVGGKSQEENCGGIIHLPG